jgi:hypothetical protein
MIPLKRFPFLHAWFAVEPSTEANHGDGKEGERKEKEASKIGPEFT